MKIWWWVGYTDRTAPVGQQALGAVIVHAWSEAPPDSINAFIKALGVHPGGEPLFGRIPESWGHPPPGFDRRLLGANEADLLARKWGGRGLASPDDIRAAFLDDEAQDGAPLFTRKP